MNEDFWKAIFVIMALSSVYIGIVFNLWGIMTLGFFMILFVLFG